MAGQLDQQGPVPGEAGQPGCPHGGGQAHPVEQHQRRADPDARHPQPNVHRVNVDKRLLWLQAVAGEQLRLGRPDLVIEFHSFSPLAHAAGARPTTAVLVTAFAVAMVFRAGCVSWNGIEPLLDRGPLMKLPPFDYEAPETVAAAVDLLAEHQDEASVLAGGQSLIPLLALRLARPAVLIDINGVQELSGLSAADGWLTVGAMTREYVAEESATVGDAVPLLAAALPLIGHEAIRSRGTIGGSLAHGDPAAELPAVALALDAVFVVRGQQGERFIPAADWFEGYLTTARRPDELLVEIRFPTAGPGTGSSFLEIARRHGDFAMVGLATSLTLADGAISDARLAFAGLSDVPVRATAAEDLLVGGQPSDDLFAEAARRATAGLEPPSDLHGSAEYRKKVAAVLVRRGLRAAADSASGRQ